MAGPFVLASRCGEVCTASYSEVSPTEFSETFYLVNLLRICTVLFLLKQESILVIHHSSLQLICHNATKEKLGEICYLVLNSKHDLAIINTVSFMAV